MVLFSSKKGKIYWQEVEELEMIMKIAVDCVEVTIAESGSIC